jgi:hypothetical protein
MTNVAVFGAGGSMGSRVVRALKDDPEYLLLCVEPSEAGQGRLQQSGLTPLAAEQAASKADVAVLAVPDVLVGKVAAQIVPLLRSEAMVVCLDPAAPYAGKLPLRKDISYFVTHPAHPPVFNDETDLEARRDFFGSGKARQAIVCALMQGPEEAYARGEKLVSRIFGPVLRAHRVTVEQMAILEPVLSETVAATCLTVIREAMDEAIRRGVPAAAARDFLMGHINIELAILFGEIDWQFSAGCKKAIENAKKQLFQPDWKKVFERQALRASVAAITGEAVT